MSERGVETLQPGDPVVVEDEGLAMLRRLMPGAPPNNHGWVRSIEDDGTVGVLFPIGGDDPMEHSQLAPYPAGKVRRRPGERIDIDG